MNTFAVSFFGHRQRNSTITVERKLENIVRELLLSKEYVEFFWSRWGIRSACHSDDPQMQAKYSSR